MLHPGLVLSLALPAFAWAVLQMVYFWPRMPERMASHFGISGKPDGWMSRKPFFWVYGVTLVVLGVLTTGTGGILLPTLYLVPAIFHLAFAFNARPGQEHLNRVVWVFLALYAIAMTVLSVLGE